MGIKRLNTFLNVHCKNETTKIHFSQLYGKKLAVDIMIYIYKYAAERTIIEGIYLLCSLFKKYNIIPIFVFDGKTPEEKISLIKERQKKREKSKKKYEELLNNNNGKIKDQKLKNQLLSLKRDSIKLKKDDIINIKELIESFGYKYIVAEYEADKLCAELVISKLVYACMSEDTDLFVYGCPRILRYLNIFNRVCVLYDLNKILKKLNLNIETLKNICILAGCDYNHTIIPLFKCYNYYLKYKKKERDVPFLEWINKWENDFIVNEKIKQMYECKKILKLSISNKPINKEELIPILKKDNFIFV